MITTVSSMRRLPLRSLSGSAYAANNQPWMRPSEWPALPTLVTGDQKFVGIYAVLDTASEFLAIQASGNYTVDWGDGNVQNVNSGVKAEHQYTYSNISGSPISLGYKIVTITVTPQSGQNLTSIYLNKRHTTQLSTGTTGWLDIAVNAPNATVIDVGGSSANSNSLVRHLLLEQVLIREHAQTNWSYVFQKCYSLASVPLFTTNSVTNMSNMFASCYSLASVPLFTTNSVTDMSSMFASCYSLTSVPLFATSAVTNMSGMFASCYSLASVPLFITSAVTNMSNMFQNCYSLALVPLFATNSVTNMSGMFQNCYSLVSLPLLNTAAVTNMSSMFQSCYSLCALPVLNLAAVSSTANTASMFTSCFSLAKSAVTGLRFAIDYTGCNLTAAAINEILSNLGAPSGGAQTITVKTNPGSSTCNTALAPAGWTVVIA